ncbi:MAG: heavy metal translocating P-type ATPase [Chloroflexaceae bacterium]|nr:heavy metal translocating P-type ATPase [Chloroflexaceae bacterium]
MLERRLSGITLLGGTALLLLVLGLALVGVPPWVTESLKVLALLVAGYPIFRSGISALLLSRQVSINLLMSIAAIGAIIIGEPLEAATVMILFGLGEALEGFTMRRSQRALQDLMQISPAEATILLPCLDCAEHMGQHGYTGGPCPWCGTHEQRLPVTDVQVGQVMLVKPGERVPLDGTIVRGSSAVNQQHLTGESMPVERGNGEMVYAGSINGNGALEVTITSPADATLISRITTLVEQAQAQRAPLERFMERFAAIYTPAVVIIATLIAVIPPMLFGQPFWNTPAGETGWFYRALSVLVIACPCALVISIPVTVVSALTTATRNGVLIKGGAVLEALQRVRVFAFDKTGTLTTGQPQVVAIQCLLDQQQKHMPCSSCDDLLLLAAAIEQHSSHPLANAVVQAAQGRLPGKRLPMVEHVEALPGRGMQGIVDGQRVIISSHPFFERTYGCDTILCDALTRAEQQGQTGVVIGREPQGMVGYLTLSDLPRSISRQVLADLQAAGITHTVILTGDHAAAAQHIATAVGATDVRAGLLPEDKLHAVAELQHDYGPVAMVGDGMNDTPALAAADIGIAMGAAGSAQALAIADIALLNDDLSRLPFLLRLSRRTNRVIRQNIVLSLLPKFIVLLLALGGWASLWLAILADMGTSLLVTANGMRLLAHKPADNYAQSPDATPQSCCETGGTCNSETCSS